MSDYPMLISNKLHSFRNFYMQKYKIYQEYDNKHLLTLGFRLFLTIESYYT